ncbi:transcriptional regulator [Cupriavidus sp. TA19]|uniref:IclR family transcriptional regulator n=1 Tax=unclassified Cupriavidus TaxID=2640874 RepID=UPI000E2E4CA0|nr:MULTISPECIES: IclR family transcriptional regulator [unclassified Cupriavidus]BDB26374.1 IclR family transcriptional regulator [Cupriavidus sp. P-10]GLC92746.1 transcriptional regulator [Cupriavidus sp. TA19]
MEDKQPAHSAGAPDTSSGVAVLDRAFAILGAFGPTDERLSLTELSRRTDLYKSTVLRLLAALEHGGYIRKLDDGQYAIGPQPLRLAAIYQRSFRVGPVIEPLLEQVSRELGETSSFYVRQGDQRLVLYRVEPARAVRVSIGVGDAFPVDRGASGKLLRAFTEPGDERWSEVRARLWAASYGERDAETASASVPVFGATGELVGALTLSGPKQRLAAAPTMYAAVATLLKVARQATAVLGGNGARYDQGIAQLSMEQIMASGATGAGDAD